MRVDATRLPRPSSCPVASHDRTFNDSEMTALCSAALTAYVPFGVDPGGGSDDDESWAAVLGPSCVVAAFPAGELASAWAGAVRVSWTSAATATSKANSI